MISVSIVAYNEAKNLERCLKSVVGWADEIVVVDLGSTDNTHFVAKSFNCCIIKHKYVPYVELVRNFAIKECQGDWILILDPDETVPKTLKEFLKKYAEKNNKGALNIPRMNIFFGEWIKHTNFWPDHQVRFFSRGTVSWQKILHSYPITTVKPIKLSVERRYAIRHTTYPTFTSFMDRQARYATIRAQERYQAGKRFSAWSLIYFPIREFLARYVKHFGFLDKKNGIVLVSGLMHYFWSAEWKLRKLERENK